MRSFVIRQYHIWCFVILFFCLSAVRTDAAVFAFPHLKTETNHMLPVTAQGSISQQSISLSFHVPTGFHVYYNSIRLPSEAIGWQLVRPTTPRYDTHLNEKVYSTNFTVLLNTDHKTPIQLPLTLSLLIQGCEDSGICFPVQRYTFSFDQHQYRDIEATIAPDFRATSITHPSVQTEEEEQSPAHNQNKDSNSDSPTHHPTQDAQTSHPVTQAETANSTPVSPTAEGASHPFAKHNPLTTLFLFLGAGLLLTFTPCVFPMIPIVISVLSQSEQKSTRHAILLACFYVLGMAITYAIIGGIAGLSGVLLSVWLQKPLFVGVFAILICLFALSMFEVFHLQIPSRLQTYLHTLGGQQSGPLGSLIMGIIASLMVGPCVAPPLASALIYISTTGNVFFGAAALFFLGIGMGIPIIIIGVIAQDRIPRSGQWMMLAKAVLGVALFYVAWFLIHGFLSDDVSLWLFGCISLFGSRILWLPQPIDGHAQAKRYPIALVQAASVALLILGVVTIAVPILDIVRPHGTSVQTTSQTTATENNRILIHSSEELAAAIQKGPSILDVQAAWCVACRELETQTFQPLRQRLSGYQWLVLDVTNPTATESELMSHYGIYGPPTLLFFKHGQEMKSLRHVGFLSAEALTQTLEQFDR